MKKLIMLSIFALGTITASANNDLFRNRYAEKADQPFPINGTYTVTMVTCDNIPNTATKIHEIKNLTQSQANYYRDNHTFVCTWVYSGRTYQHLKTTFVPTKIEL